MMDEMKKLVNEAKDYIAVRKDLVKLKTAESLSETAGNIVTYAMLAVVGLFALMFVSITLALGIGWALDNNFWGFLIVTAIYIGAGLFLYYNKEQIVRIPILNSLLQSMFKDKNPGDEASERNKAA